MSGTQFFHVHLFVTGHAERDHLPEFFSLLSSTGLCRFVVARRISQHSPRSKSRQLKMIGHRGDAIPTKLTQEVSFPARNLLVNRNDQLVMIVDDLEHDRRHQAEEVFQLYREALNKLLHAPERSRAAVHFLNPMLEAYFFGHPEAIMEALSQEIVPTTGDAEEIRHPKGLLKKLLGDFREREDGGAILKKIDLAVVLSNPEHCAYLRSCVGWLTETIREGVGPSLAPSFDAIESGCHLEHGRSVPWLRHQP